MVNFSPEKLVMIAILALLVLGPNRLPAAARSAGRLLAELRRMSGSLQGELHEALAEPRDALEHAAREFGVDPRPAAVATSLRSGVREAFLGTGTAGGEVAPASNGSAGGPSSRPVTAPGEPPAPDDPALN